MAKISAGLAFLMMITPVFGPIAATAQSGSLFGQRLTDSGLFSRPLSDVGSIWDCWLSSGARDYVSFDVIVLKNSGNYALSEAYNTKLFLPRPLFSGDLNRGNSRDEIFKNLPAFSEINSDDVGQINYIDRAIFNGSQETNEFLIQHGSGGAAHFSPISVEGEKRIFGRC